MIRTMAKMMEPVRRSVGLMVRRSIVTRVDDTLRTQNLQLEVLVDEIGDPVEHFQPVGFTSVPLPGAEALVLAVGGAGDHRIAAVVNDKRSRPVGAAAGDTLIYHCVTGNYIWLRANGAIEVVATTAVKITAPTVTLKGNLHVDGNISDSTGSMATMRAQHNAHNHPPTATTPPSVLMD